MEKCFLEGFGECAGKISREHYISATVLRAITPQGNVSIGGLAWQPEQDTVKSYGLASLQSKILCRSHNTLMSDLDDEAGKLTRYLVAVDKDPNSVPHDVQFDGEKIQRWMLKTLIATSEANAFSCSGMQARHKKILMGKEWPAKWGLYVSNTPGIQVFTQDLHIETAVREDNNDLLAAAFRIAGVQFSLVIGNLLQVKSLGIYRPRGLVFKIPGRVKRIELRWRGPTRKKTVEFHRVGKDSGSIPLAHLQGWKGLQ